MTTFKLPDLGEGLPEATIREWLVNEGQHVQKGQPMVTVETAKALVEVPSPQDGVVESILVNNDETISTGTPLMSFVTESKTANDNNDTSHSNTVVGNIETTNDVITQQASTTNHSATPAARALARRHGITLSDVPYAGSQCLPSDIHAFMASSNPPLSQAGSGYTPLSGQRKAMAQAMQASQQRVIPAALFEEAPLNSASTTPITLQVIRAVVYACRVVPILNTHYDNKTMSYQTHEDVHLGIAIDTPKGLYVPVIKHINTLSDEAIIAAIKDYKQQAETHTLSSDDQKGASFTLSNIGTIAGRFATPIITTPQVGILAVGQRYELPQLVDGNLTTQAYLPLSLSFDHQIVTGGEAGYFLKAMKEALASTPS